MKILKRKITALRAGIYDASSKEEKNAFRGEKHYMSLIFIEDVIILSGHTSILLFCSYFTKKEIVNLYASFQLAKLS